MTFEYNAFLSHISTDRSAVEVIARSLHQQYALKCLLDRWNLVPGEPWQEALEEAIDRCETVAVFAGPQGIGPWENEEMRSALQVRLLDKNRRVIPVLLPGAPGVRDLNLPRFLARMTWVDFRDGLHNEEALYQLYCGIKGMIPGVAREPRPRIGRERDSEEISQRQKPVSTGSLFISYRRSDSADVTGRIYDRLAGKFGKEQVFKDVDSIPLGVNFKEFLDASVGACKVLLAVIGKGWLEAKDEAGRVRLKDSTDYVRLEIESALQRKIPIIPLLVGGASMPSAKDLPRSLSELAFRNGLPIRPDPDFHKDIDRLISALELILSAKSDQLLDRKSG